MSTIAPGANLDIFTALALLDPRLKAPYNQVVIFLYGMLAQCICNRQALPLSPIGKRFNLMASITASVAYLDSAGVEKREVMHFPSGTTLAQIQGWLDGALPNIDAVTGAQITDVNINYNHAIGGLGLKGAPEADSSYAQGALLSFRAQDTQAYSLFLPSVKDEFVSGGQIAVANELATFVSQVSTAGVDVAATPIFLSNRGGSSLSLALGGAFRRAALRSRKL